ncbi:hypothetical protein ACQKOE_07750 [Novosphingobium sp. NPDC080210]|uniref:hypothetical protein n=1 Tax=Novosphingobium sp. NPDC080210 TaxID=3390596 RepID=UPI003CFC712D
MFRPNITAQLIRKGATRDIFGQPSYGAPAPLRCAVVRLTTDVVPSTVRADSSASRGAAEETTAQAVILVPATTAIAVGDVLELLGERIEVTGRHPRINTRGTLDHIEIHGKIDESS